MKSVRYAIYLCITLHFLRRCLRKSLTQVRHPAFSLTGEIGGRESLPESLRPAYDEMLAEMDRETLKAMVEVARTEKPSYGFRFADRLVNTMVNTIRSGRMAKDINKRFADSVEVRSVSASRSGDETQLNIDCVLSRPVEYVDMKVHL
jgi:hypothetical protein